MLPLRGGLYLFLAFYESEYTFLTPIVHLCYLYVVGYMLYFAFYGVYFLLVIIIISYICQLSTNIFRVFDKLFIISYFFLLIS